MTYTPLSPISDDFEVDQQKIQQSQAAAKQSEQDRQQIEQGLKEQTQIQTEQSKPQPKDSFEQKDPSKFGTKENVQELGNALVGGGQDAINSVIGAVQKPFDPKFYQSSDGEEYRPSWLLFNPEDQPINKTVWGKLLRGAVEFGGLAVGVRGGARGIAKAPIPGLQGAARYVAKGPAPASGITKAGRAANLGKSLAHSAVVGAIADGASNQSSNSNLAQTLTEIFPHHTDAIRPFATNADMTPAQRTLMNIGEGLALGTLFDLALQGGGRALKAVLPSTKPTALNKAPIGVPERTKGGKVKRDKDGNVILTPVKTRQQLQDDNELSLGEQRLKDDPMGEKGYDPTINQGAEVNQGRVNSNIKSASKTLQDIEDIKLKAGQEDGSPNAILTEKEMERINATPGGSRNATISEMTAWMNDDPEYAAKVQDLGRNFVKQRDYFGKVYDDLEQALAGREVRNLTDDELQALIGPATEISKGIEYVDIDGHLKTGMLLSFLDKEMRDLGFSALSVMDNIDVTAKDGQFDRFLTRWKTLQFTLKKSRYIRSNALSDLKYGPADVKVKLDEIATEVDESAAFLASAVKAGQMDDTLRMITHFMAMSDGIRSWDDLDKLVRKRLNTNVMDGKNITAQEMGATMIHSVLSGVRTPLRAVVGTALNTVMRPIATVSGGLVGMDGRAMRSGMIQLGAMWDSLSDTWKIFNKRLKANFGNGVVDDIGTMSKFYLDTDADVKWESYGQWAKDRGSDAEKAVYAMGDMFRAMNKNPLLTYGVRVMDASDFAFQHIMGRARMKELAFNKVFDAAPEGKVITDADINQMMIDSQKEFEAQVFNADGTIKDEISNYAAKEAAFTLDMPNWLKGVENLFKTTPMLKPFLMFPRTSWNALELTGKHMPLLNRTIKEVSDIKNLEPGSPELHKYGIYTVADHMAAKNLVRGREAIGMGTVALMTGLYMSGKMTGNGPADPARKKYWREQLQYPPRSFLIGDKWISYDSLEPFSAILAVVADVGDMQMEMGDDFVEAMYGRLGYVLYENVVNKSFMTGVGQLTQIMEGVRTGEAGTMLTRYAATFANNQVPLSSLRNDISRTLNPGMREVEREFVQSIQNRNLFIPNDLEYKTDLFTGERIKDYDPITRAINLVSPFQMNPDASPVKQMVARSKFDLALTINTWPGGDEPIPADLKAKFQHYVGRQQVGKKLEKLFSNPQIIASIEKMEYDRRHGGADTDPMTYFHNQQQQRIWQDAKRSAMAEMRRDSDAQPFIQNAEDNKLKNRMRKQGNYKVADQLDEVRKFGK